MLIASIVHDFALKSGYLFVTRDGGKIECVKIQRRVADGLFRDIVAIVSGNRAEKFFLVFCANWSGS